MKRLFIMIFICVAGIFNNYSYATNENPDSLSQEERYAVLLDRMKTIPMLDAASKYDYGDIRMTIDTIPEASRLFETYSNGIFVFFQQDYDLFNDIIIQANKTYVDLADRLADDSMLHFFRLYCNALICIMHNNTNAGLYYMLMCDQFLAKYDTNSIFRLQTMPSIADFNYSIGNVKNGDEWMNATWHFLEERNLTKSMFALNFLITYAARKAIEKDNETVDFLYGELFDILKELQADDFIIKDFKASYMWQLLQSERIEELFEYAANLENELDRYEVRDAEILLFCNVLKVIYAIYADEGKQETEAYLQELDDISRWLFATQMPKLPNEFRTTYWNNQIRCYLDMLPNFPQLFDSPSYRIMLYNLQLLTNGTLLSSNCSFDNSSLKI